MLLELLLLLAWCMSVDFIQKSAHLFNNVDKELQKFHNFEKKISFCLMARIIGFVAYLCLRKHGKFK